MKINKLIAWNWFLHILLFLKFLELKKACFLLLWGKSGFSNRASEVLQNSSWKNKILVTGFKIEIKYWAIYDNKIKNKEKMETGSINMIGK